MKISKSKIKSLVVEAMKNTLKEEDSPFGNLTGDLSSSIENSKGVKIPIPDGYFKMSGSSELAAAKGDPFEYVALINNKTNDTAFMVIKGNGTPKGEKAVGKVFNRGHAAHTKLEQRYNKAYPNPYLKDIKAMEGLYKKYRQNPDNMSDSELNKINSITEKLPDQTMSLVKSRLLKLGGNQADVEMFTQAVKSAPNDSKGSTSAIAGHKKEEANESKMMNENRIRAIIRHELIQSMKK